MKRLPMSAESILLPLVEVEDIRHEAEVEAAGRGEDIPAQFAAGDTAVLRAQVRKVASELERYIDSGECPFSERDENGECDWESCKVCRARYFVVALKAAGEEESK